MSGFEDFMKKLKGEQQEEEQPPAVSPAPTSEPSGSGGGFDYFLKKSGQGSEPETGKPDAGDTGGGFSAFMAKLGKTEPAVQTEAPKQEPFQLKMAKAAYEQKQTAPNTETTLPAVGSAGETPFQLRMAQAENERKQKEAGAYASLLRGLVPGEQKQTAAVIPSVGAETQPDTFSGASGKIDTGGSQAHVRGEKVRPDTRSGFEKFIQRVVGYDPAKVTGEKTDWGKLAAGTVLKGVNNFSNGFWKTADFLLGDAAQTVHDIATMGINDAIETSNSLFGTDYDYLSPSDNLITRARKESDKSVKAYDKWTEANRNSSAAAQIVDTLGTATVQALPFLIETMLTQGATAPGQSVESAAAGMNYASALGQASGAEATGLMLKEGITKAVRDPSFWTSYVQTAGPSYEAAKQDGMGEVGAALYGLTNGFFNALIEIGGGIQDLDSKWWKRALGEAKEEVLQGATERGLKTPATGAPLVSFDPEDDRAVLNPTTAAQEAFGGFAVGSLLSGFDIGKNRAGKSAVQAQEQADARESPLRPTSPQKSEGDIPVPPTTETARTGEPERFNTATESEAEAEPRVYEEPAAEQPTEPAPAATEPTAKPAAQPAAESAEQATRQTAISEMVKEGMSQEEAAEYVDRFYQTHGTYDLDAEPTAEKQTEINAALWTAPKDNGGWKQFYNGDIPIADAMKVVDPAFQTAMETEASSGEAHTPLVDAYIAAWQDVRQGTISPMAAATLLSEAYQNGGADEVSRLYRSATGNLTRSALERAKGIDAGHVPAESAAPAAMVPYGETQLATAQTGTEMTQPQGQQTELTGEEEQPGMKRNRTETDEAFRAAADRYGVIEPGESPARESAIPRQTRDETAVGRTARTIYEAAATPEARLQDVRNAVVDGKFDYVPVSNEKLAARAREKVSRDGWDYTINNWLAEVKSGKRNENLVAMGAVLLNNAGNSGMSGTQYAQIAAAYHSLVHNEARGLAAARILKTLTPEARLYGILKEVQTMNDEIEERNEGKRSGKPDAARVSDAVNAAKRKAAETVAENWRKFGFADEAAKQVADSIKRQIKGSFSEKTQSALDTFVSYVKKFAAEKTDLGKKGRKPMTVSELLGEVARNESLFREVYEKAQALFMDENGTGYREFVRDYLNEPVNLNAADGQRGRLFARAIAESALSTGENATYIRNQSALGISNATIAERIAENLIRETGAGEALADSIREAANRYVTYTVQSDGTAEGTRAERIVAGMMKNMAARFTDVAVQDQATKDSIAKDLSDQLAIEYGLSPESAKTVAEAATAEYERQLAEAMEKEVARRFAPKKARKGQVKDFADSLTEAINLGTFDSDFADLATDKLFGTTGGVTLDPALTEKYLAQTTEEGRDAVIDEMMRDVARQVPSTFMDKWTAWRYTSMLGNFKTQARNVIGNTSATLTRLVKDKYGAVAEALASATGLYKGERTKSLVGGVTHLGEAWADYENVKDVVEGDGKYRDAKSTMPRKIDEYRTIFKNNGDWGTDNARTSLGKSKAVKGVRKGADLAMKGLEGYRKATQWAMTEGDNIFLRLNYADALAGYLAANKVKSIESASPELLERARAYAIRQAQEATFHDDNSVSDFVSSFDAGWDRNAVGKVAKAAVQGVMPFRKTPANVLVRAEEYSPLGLLNTAVKAVQAANGKPGVTGADVIESLSKTLTGSSLTVLGYLLAAAGHARGKGDEDDKELTAFQKQRGAQDYSIVFDDGSSFTLDWLSPSAVPLFMGVNFYEALGEKQNPIDALGLLGSVTDPVLNMSMLSGLNDALDNISSYNDKVDALPSLALNSLLGYLTQGLTNTMLGQAEQASEETRQTWYTDPGSGVPPALQKVLAKASAKTPGWDYQQQDYIDAWGRKQENGTPLERVTQAFLNPGYVGKDRSTPIDGELERLYKATGVKAVLPKTPSRSEDVNNERLTPEEYQTYAESRGQLAYELISNFVESDAYKDMADDERADAIANMWEYATNRAKREISMGRGAEQKKTTWDKVAALEDPESYIAARDALTSAIDNGDYKRLDAYLSDGGLYGQLSDKAKDMLGGVDKLKKLSALHDAGLDAETGMTVIAAVNAVETAEGKSRTQQQEVDAIIGTDLSDKDKLAAIRAYTSESYAEKVQAAVDSGLSLEKWSEIYHTYRDIDDLDLKNSQKADLLAAALDKDKSLTGKQRETILDNLKYYNMVPAEAKRYGQLKDAGADIDRAVEIADAMRGAEKQDEIVDKILSSKWSEADQWRALKVYASESYYEKAAYAYRRGIDLADYVRDYREADANGKNGLSQEELFDFYRKDPANEAFVKIMWAQLFPKTTWDSYRKKHGG